MCDSKGAFGGRQALAHLTGERTTIPRKLGSLAAQEKK